MSDKTSWAKWLKHYGAEKFYDAFMRNAQGAESVCIYCKRPITLDIAEGGGVPDWSDNGDYGCFESPDTDDDGTGGHMPKVRRR